VTFCSTICIFVYFRLFSSASRLLYALLFYEQTLYFQIDAKAATVEIDGLI
jgi:hypothetical protein